MNPIQRARQTSRQVHKQLGGVYVQIERDGDLSDPILVTLGYSKTFEDEQDYLRTVHNTRDYIFGTNDYNISGVILEPEIGDFIYETINGNRRKFEVEPHDNEFVSVYTDSERKNRRVHTKEVYHDGQ